MGNDIITTSSFFTKSEENKYVEKLLTEDEKKHYSNPQDLLKYWVAKESAYKISIKYRGERKLNPKCFNVSFNDNEIVVHESSSGREFHGQLSITDSYIHAVVWDSPLNTNFNVHRFNDKSLRSELIREELAKFCNLNKGDIYKDGRGIPRYPGWDISFSHSTPYSMWSAQKIV